MRILVVGGGAREHAIVWRLSLQEGENEMFCAPGNAGIAELASCVEIHPTNIIELADFAQSLSMDLTIVGPELPLSLGIVDEFQKRGLPIFGPTQTAAQIECSKAWAREFFAKYDIPGPKFAITFNKQETLKTIKQNNWGYPIVLKVDGLAQGKGTIIAQKKDEVEDFLEHAFIQKTYGIAGEKIILEEFLEGIELSFQVVTDGYKVMPLASAQDYKRQLDGDNGPNTGGMGSYSPSVYMNLETHQKIMNSIIIPTVQGLENEGRLYKGVLYAGVILTKQGPKLLEYNARFGDPETQAIMPRLQGNCIECLQAAIVGRLHDIKLEWKKEACICIVLASKGYPDSYEINKEISGLEAASEIPSVQIFHAGTKKENGTIVSSGGRVLSVTATAPSLSQAYERAYSAIDLIHFDGMQCRKDIAVNAIEYFKQKQ
ncbi:MAG: phosphoribosylamine--glycine ligase [Candidatus Fischerbacteria bacterium RBG_13_37_8]|uniref:Phosphoribosylamine--glycine ligase n=1 Tax=Candidatus Fischerbacteria bacterium RBG_13_37_8 TaxID=1817863 RepID=A0A1F5VVQ3_9BACT|nr:MAG: phosphoribosylamine--glycine ligase [Candidatus Fischerbacteria bacterium RBG_13_37_8]